MLRSQLTAALVAGALVTAGCSGADGTERGAIRENVIEPGITAIDDSNAAACASEASSFRTALEAYEVLQGEPAPDEQALIDSGLLRSESELWDVVDGELLSQGAACGAVDAAATITTVEIVTDVGAEDVPALTVDEIIAGLSDADIASAGGPECARELTVLVIGAREYQLLVGDRPESVEQIDAAQLLPEPVELWQIVDGVERPVEGSGCIDLAPATADG